MTNHGCVTIPGAEDDIILVAERVQAIDIRHYEAMSPAQLVAELLPVVSELLLAASAIAVRVIEKYDRIGPTDDTCGDGGLTSPYMAFEKAIDAAVGAQCDATYRAVADIAFLGQLELRQRCERLARISQNHSPMTIVGECDGALRRIRKVMTALDRALARAGILEPRLDFATELELSLRVRTAYAKFRTQILSDGDPTAETLYIHLRRAGTTIAMLVGWEIYPQFRVLDRLQIRVLQHRVLDWLRGERNVTAGMHLWQDLTAFAHMLAQVSRRQELVDHDTRVVRDAWENVAAGGDTLPDEVLRALSTLDGLDDAVDAVLASRDRARPGAWYAPLDRLRRQLGANQDEIPERMMLARHV